MLVTLSGIDILVRLVQLRKAACPMIVTPLPIVILVSLVQSENAPPPIFVTLSGIVTLVSSLQSEKAEEAMPSVPSFNTTEVLLGIVPL